MDNILTSGSFTRLRTLQLWNCSEADALLIELIDLNRKTAMRLHGLVLSFEEPDEAPHRALEFLSSISGLKYLNLCYCPGDNTVKLGGFLLHVILESHRASLKDLYIGIGANNSRHDPLDVPDYYDLRAVCYDYKEIRQLAVAMPTLQFEDAFANQWGAFGAYLVSLLL